MIQSLNFVIRIATFDASSPLGGRGWSRFGRNPGALAAITGASFAKPQSSPGHPESGIERQRRFDNFSPDMQQGRPAE